MSTDAVLLQDIRKTFGGFVALDDVSFAARFGEVHALLGENGAGKSSLMNVLSGLYAPEAGRIVIDGAERRFSGPLDAVFAGIGMIHQHFKLVNKFTVLENIQLALSVKGRMPPAPELAEKVRGLARSLNAEIDPQAVVGGLSIAERQRAEIVKALALGSRILILDEPTAVLTEREAAALYGTLHELAGQGACVILVTHKLSDVRGVADRATVMRQGRVVAVVDAKATSTEELTTLTVGSEVPLPRRSAVPPGEEILRIEGVSSAADSRVNLSGASFRVRAGEIYGIAGIGGNGQTELVDILAGVGSQSAGAIALGDGAGGWSDLAGQSPRALLGRGLVCIPADRQHSALAPRLSVQDNYAIAHLGTRTGPWAWLSRRAVKALAGAAVAGADVQGVRSLSQRAALLSGGNAQKLVVARELSREPRVIVAHSPCRGLDVRAAATVQERLLEARNRGIAVVLISEDLDEVLAIADRIGVMSAGAIVAEFDAPADRAAIGNAMVNHV